MPITTSMMATLRLADEVTLAAWWDGGREIGIHIDAGNGAACVHRWNVWNDVWDCPLIEPTLESFERFMRGRLAEPGMLAELVAAGGAR